MEVGSQTLTRRSSEKEHPAFSFSSFFRFLPSQLWRKGREGAYAKRRKGGPLVASFLRGGGPRLKHSLSSYSPRRVNFSSYFIFFIWRGGRKEKVGIERGGGGDEATGGLIRMADTRSPRVVCCLDRPASCAWHAKSSCRVRRSDFFFSFSCFAL